MLNIDAFIKRLETLLDYYAISASVFADKLGVQRSGLSHLMSGRNKPSLDFVMKITESFPEVDLYWLLNGTGDFPKKEGPVQTFAPPVIPPAPSPSPPKTVHEDVVHDLFTKPATEAAQQNRTEEKANTIIEKIINTPEDVERIVVFYKNGVFKSYTPEN